MYIRQTERGKNVQAFPCYLSSSDGYLGLLIYRLVTGTAYQQQPRPSAHAHREGLIWIFEGKTRTPHRNARTQLPTNPGLSLLSIVWLRLLSPGVTASRWLALSCQSRPGAHTHAQTHTHRWEHTLIQIVSYCTQNICTLSTEWHWVFSRLTCGLV